MASLRAPRGRNLADLLVSFSSLASCLLSSVRERRLGSDSGVKHVLLQLQGGPCGVLAPVQAFLIKHLIFKAEFGGSLDSVTPEEIQRALKGALCETLWRAGKVGAVRPPTR